MQQYRIVCVSNMEGIHFLPCKGVFYYVSKCHNLRVCLKEVFVIELVIITWALTRWPKQAFLRV